MRSAILPTEAFHDARASGVPSETAQATDLRGRECSAIGIDHACDLVLAMMAEVAADPSPTPHPAS